MDVLMLIRTTLLTLLLTECGAQLNVCGQPNGNFNSRIVGGEVATAGAWPWQVSLHFSGGSHFCGASLINSEWLLSAAHCFTSTRSVTAFLGRQSQLGSNPNEQSRDIAEAIPHPDYDPATFDNDVALLRLSSPVTFTDFIKPVCLAAIGSTFFKGTGSFVTGWGTVGEGVPLPSPGNLMEVEVPVVGNRQCNCDYSSSFNITNNMICAGLRQGGNDSCQGDSGGPMVSKQNAKWVLSGVVSFGIGCARPGIPGIYARVSQYEDWIKSRIGGSNLPGFVTFTSTGTDPDLAFNCGNSTPTEPPVATAAPPLSCGSAPLNGRLSGLGTASAAEGAWPWMASLHWNGSHVCGGTLVAENTVLTSAQCVARSNTPSEWTVFLGRLKQNGSNSFEMAVRVIDVRNSTLSGQNVAVLQLESSPLLSNYIQPICLDNGQTFAPNTTCWAAGWSADKGGEEQVLQEVQTSVVDCGNMSSSDTICTELLTLEQEEYGGPLMCRLGNFWYQAAVLGTGSNATSPIVREVQITVFPKVSRFSNFLIQAIQDFSPSTGNDSSSSDFSDSPPSTLLNFLMVVSSMGLHAVIMVLCH